MPLYLVLDSFVSLSLGVHHFGEVIDLSDAAAQGLPVMRVKKEQPAETADLHLENIETADAQPVRKGRNNAHPTRKPPL